LAPRFGISSKSYLHLSLFLQHRACARIENRHRDDTAGRLSFREVISSKCIGNLSDFHYNMRKYLCVHVPVRVRMSSKSDTGEDVELCEIVFRLYASIYKICAYMYAHTYVCMYLCMHVCMYVHARGLRTYSSRSRCGRVAGPSGNTASSWDTML
jgi:hypothetical protein